MASKAVEGPADLASVGECIADAVRRWPFSAPEGGGIVSVSHPFELQSRDR